MFVDTGKIFGFYGKEPTVMQKKEELKIEKAREEWKNLSSLDISYYIYSSKLITKTPQVDHSIH